MPRLRTSSQTVATIKKELKPKSITMTSFNKKLNEACMRIDYDRRISAAKTIKGPKRTLNMTQKKKISKQLELVSKMHRTLETLSKTTSNEKGTGAARKTQKKK